MTLALVSDPQETDADGTPLKEGDTIRIGSIDYHVVLAQKKYTDATLDGHRYIYVIGNGSDTLVDDAFNGCTTIRDVYFSDTVKHIGDRAFKGTTNLSYVYAIGAESIGEEAFMGSGLESCLFREKLTTIGDDAFRDCADFERFRFHYTSVTSIGSGVFAGSGLECLDLRKVTSIHPDAFTGSALTIQIVGTEQGRPLRVGALPERHIDLQPGPRGVPQGHGRGREPRGPDGHGQTLRLQLLVHARGWH